MKKIFGVIFITIASILALPIVGQPDKVIKNLFGIVSVLKGDMNEFQIGIALGHMTFEILYISAVFFLGRYGMRWVFKKPKD